MNKGDKIKMIERCKWSPLMMIIVIFNMITITMIGWNVCFCERPRALCVVGEVWDRMGADSKVLGGSARAHAPNIIISTKSSSLSLNTQIHKWWLTIIYYYYILHTIFTNLTLELGQKVIHIVNCVIVIVFVVKYLCFAPDQMS